MGIFGGSFLAIGLAFAVWGCVLLIKTQVAVPKKRRKSKSRGNSRAIREEVSPLSPAISTHTGTHKSPGHNVIGLQLPEDDLAPLSRGAVRGKPARYQHAGLRPEYVPRTRV